jgi:hypothetical protein
VNREEPPPPRAHAWDYLTKPEAEPSKDGRKTIKNFNESEDPTDKEIRGEVEKWRTKATA